MLKYRGHDFSPTEEVAFMRVLLENYNVLSDAAYQHLQDAMAITEQLLVGREVVVRPYSFVQYLDMYMQLRRLADIEWDTYISLYPKCEYYND